MFLLRAGLQQKANISAEEWNDSCIRKQTNGGRPKKISNTESSLDTDDFRPYSPESAFAQQSPLV